MYMFSWGALELAAIDKTQGTYLNVLCEHRPWIGSARSEHTHIYTYIHIYTYVHTYILLLTVDFAVDLAVVSAGESGQSSACDQKGLY